MPVPRKQKDEMARPVSDDAKGGKKVASKSRAGKLMEGSSRVAVAKHEGPQASTLPAMMGIIDPMSAGRPQRPGIPGLIHSTTLGPEQRQRLVSGIIETTMVGRGPEGPVHKVAGHDATAYNQGMVHIPGSPFSSRY